MLFWHHIWAGVSNLKSCFPRLFRLSSRQGGSVKNMGRWVQGTWVWELEWRRELLDRKKEQVSDFYSFLSNFSLKSGAVDSWRWGASPNRAYSTKSAYDVFRNANQRVTRAEVDQTLATIWKAPAPIKALTTVWRIMKGKMATCDNLARRNISIPSDEAKCVACRRVEETTNHYFFTCQEAREVWNFLLRWLGIQTAMAHNARDHFLHFTNMGEKSDRKFLAGLWCATTWNLWKWRNDITFNNLKWDIDKIMGEIKTRFWEWNSAFGVEVFPSDFRSWFKTAMLPSHRSCNL